MRSIAIILVCILTTFCINAQTQKQKIRTIISGNLLVPDDSTLVKLRIFDYSLPDVHPANKIEQISTNGSFHFEIDISHPVYIDLDTNNVYKLYFRTIQTANCAFRGTVFSTLYNATILVEPGDSLHIDLKNIDNYCDIIFSGKGSEKGKCVQDILKSTRNYDSPAMNMVNWKLRDSLQVVILNTIEKHRSVLTPVARDIIKVEYCLMLLRDASEFVRAGLIDITNEEGRKEYRAFVLRSRSYFNPANRNMIYTNEVRNVLTRRALVDFAIENNISYPDDFTDGKFSLDYYNAIDKNLNGMIKYNSLATYLVRKSNKYGLSNELISGSKKFFLDPQAGNIYRKRVRDSMIKWEDKLASGTPAYQFSLPDTTGLVLKMNNFKGKVVVIDFMFKGCAGCVLMVPALAKVEERFRNEQIAFISISTDKTVSDWKKAIGTSSVSTSIQLYTEGKGTDHPIILHYSIPSYPTLVLIDQDGKLVTARAPNPRNDEGKALTALIQKLLSRKNNNY